MSVQTMDMTFSEFRKTLLANLYKSVEDDTTRLINPTALAESIRLPYRKGWVRQAMQSFDAEGLIRLSQTLGGGSDGGLHMSFTGAGIEEAESLLAEGWDQFERPQSPEPKSAIAALREQGLVPASDREVALNHNSVDFQNLDGTLRQVSERLRGENQLSAAQPEEYQQHIAEVQAGQVLLKGAKVRVGALVTTAFVGLMWFLDQFAGQALEPLILAALKALGAYFGLNYW